MSRRLKVYGWYGWRLEAAPRQQTREIVAAPSVAAIMRGLGCTRSRLWNICETGNAQEIAITTAEPGVLFWRQIDDHKGAYTRAERLEGV